VSNKTLERFGKYLLLDHLVDGGMAKIWRARYLGEEANKIVAIKMVQTQFSNDEAFKTMFLDEIKVTFGLIHPNIVQTYDYGIHQGQLYVAMEYCDGKNLKQALDKLKPQKVALPIEVSSYIISQVCQALHYAHNYTDRFSGERANIIHRDISPHNIMMTYDGAVKVIDFGIAKAKTNSEATQAGTIKGKLSYLAPEYLEGKELDHRYDQFAVGVTFWELLCGQKLFSAPNDLAVLKKIQECRVIPPSKINPTVPPEMDQIVLKMLQRDPNLRFKDMGDLNKSLLRFLSVKFPEFGMADLSFYNHTIFKDEIAEDRKAMKQFGLINLAPYLQDLKHEKEKTKTVTKMGQTPSKAALAKEEEGTLQTKRELDFGFDQNSSEKSQISRVWNPTRTIGLNGEKDVAPQPLHRQATKIEMSGIQEREGDEGPSFGQKILGLLKIAGAAGILFYFAQTSFGRGLLQKVPVIGSFFKTEVSTTKREVANSNKTSVEKTVLREITFTGGFDRQRDDVFLNGMIKKVSILNNSIKIDGDVSFPLHVRVESPGRMHFIQTIKASEFGENAVTVDVPDWFSREKIDYAYMIAKGQNCSGKEGSTIRFKLFNEERNEKIPFDQIAIHTGEVDFVYIDVKLNLERQVKINFERPDQVINICDRI
jgi:eukaryotic-like serine/threonine-protein kinase